MKSINNIFDEFLDIEKIKEIIVLAAKHKKHRASVQKVLADIDNYAKQILGMLESGEYWQYPSHRRTITEKGKQRELTVSPFFPNRILDYIAVEAVKPYIKKSMYEYCIGNVDKRGTLYGRKVIGRKYQKYRYFMKLDIRKFYPSTKSAVMLDFIRSKVRDERYMRLCEFVIGANECLPIGSYYSQWFSNWLLQDLDHKIKEQYKVPFYVRYVDDMLLMGDNKRKLKHAMYLIERELKRYGLSLKEHAQVKQTEATAIDFLGFRFRAGRVKLRLRNFKNLNRQTKKIRRRNHICLSQAEAMVSRIAWLHYVDGGYAYYANRIAPVCPSGKARRIISSANRTVLPKMQAAA